MSDMEGVEEALGATEEDGEVLYSPGVSIPEEMQEEIVNYVKDEVELMANSREERERSWNVWRRHREGEPETERKDFPWDGASNVVPPVSASNTSGVFSHIRRAFLKRKPLFTPEPYTKEMAQKAASFGKLLNIYFEARSKSNSRPRLKKALYEAISLGNQVVEVPWVERRVRFNRPSFDGSVEKIDKIVYSGPVMVLHRIENVYVRPEVETIEEQPVIAVRYEGYTPGKLQELQRDGFFRDVEPVVAAGQSSEEDDNLEDMLSRDGLEVVDSSETPMIDLMKAWVYWDIDNDGVPEDVIVWYHDETETVLRIEVNELGQRILVNLQYLAKAFSFYATGVGQMAEHVQEEITSLHNMRVNSLSLSSLQMLVTKPGTDLGKGQKLYPLKNIRAEEPASDVNVLTFPDVSGATLNAEIQAKRYLDTHTGVSEAMLGMPDQTAKSGTSPSLQMFLAEQGNAILETAVENLAEGLSEIGNLFTLQMVKNSDSILPYLEELVDEDEVELVREFLEMEIDDVPLRVGMSVRTTEIQKSEDAKRQNLMTLNQLYTMYGQEIMQYMQVIQSPEVPEDMKTFAARIYLGKTKVMEETLELFGTSDTEDYVPYVRDVEMMLEMVDAQKRALADQIQSQMRGAQNGTGAGAAVGGVGGGMGRGVERAAVGPGAGGNPPQGTPPTTTPSEPNSGEGAIPTSNV